MKFVIIIDLKMYFTIIIKFDSFDLSIIKFNYSIHLIFHYFILNLHFHHQFINN